MTPVEAAEYIRQWAGTPYWTQGVQQHIAKAWAVLRSADAILARLADDGLADAVAHKCGTEHALVKPRYCPQCVNRFDAIDAYRRAVQESK